MNPREPAALLQELVRIPSISKNEAPLADRVAEILSEDGFEPVRSGRNVWCRIGNGSPSLLLNTHLDTVPIAPGWTRDPHAALLDGGRIFGLGANDAKGCLTAMLLALPRLRNVRGSLYLAATCDEEVGKGEGLEVLLPTLPPMDAAIVGEPSSLNIARAQRGLVVLKNTARGRSGHASRPLEGINAIEIAAADVIALKHLTFDRPHPLLGNPTIQVTLVQGGTTRNMIPAECTYTCDIRTTPNVGNEAIIEKIRSIVLSHVEVASQRLHPRETPENSRIVQAARRAQPKAEVYGFPSLTDLVHVPGPGIVLGPGHRTQSHAPDESIEIAEVARAVEVYARTVEEYFGGSS